MKVFKTEANQQNEDTQIQRNFSVLFQSNFCQKNWLKMHGKQKYLPFTNEALIQLRKYFNSLDANNGGSIGIDELQDPFIAFGISNNREEVQKLIKSVDLDGSGKIQFDEFLAIMKNIKKGKENTEKNSAMKDFFQRMREGKLGEEYDKDISFRLNVSQFRRKKILQSIMAVDKQKKQSGTKIMNNFKKQVVNTPHLRLILNEVKNNNSLVIGFNINGKKNFNQQSK